MKDQDNKTNALCYCKGALPLKKLSTTKESKETIASTAINPGNNDRSKPWSVFGEWYWI